ncbi:potassium channel family protein [Metabacillus sediminilitoris]|uniref:TrkA family potassium uptake protein n=1 Tax=Metabacillus sediminilitoris TaxID=2567941 RepID=A0A4S4BUU5_9BACI|nr:TrkA family potassium uptake protein [Metabacillus sediminilitoris]QGQ44761.1 TrkA family potassium uptake protein [Metabacillus sediminilitoris]THF78891.1 TrkA family potassium uptake protein [Metabacillus sediminilitoris]
MAIKQYAVIGLGRFGTSIARRLNEAGQEVLGIDVNEERVEDVELYVTHAAVADSTDEKALTSLGVRNFDCVIVAIGNDMQASILTVMLLKDLGVKKVIAKALGKRHGKVLDRIGADWIIYPERDMGERVANQLLSPNMLNYIELSKEYNIEEIMIPSKMAGKNLRELDIRAKYNISVIAIVSEGDIIISPSPEQTIHEGDLLVVIGSRDDLANFSSIE